MLGGCIPRKPVLVLLVASLLGAVALAWLGPTSASSRRLIICPLAHKAAITCCGPPRPLPNGSACPGALSMRAAPNPSTAGHQVVISGQLPTRGAFAPVTLWQRLNWQTKFHKLLTVRTDAAGAYSITRPAGSVQTNRHWYVAAQGLQSVDQRQRVRALITLRASAPSADSGTAETLSGQVTPSHVGERVKIEQRQNSAWKVLARPVINPSSTFH